MGGFFGAIIPALIGAGSSILQSKGEAKANDKAEEEARERALLNAQIKGLMAKYGLEETGMQGAALRQNAIRSAGEFELSANKGVADRYADLASIIQRSLLGG